MLNSRTKDKIYALLSFLAIVLAIGSFVLTINFLLKINKYIFSVNQQTVKEKTTVVDKAGFETIKERLRLKKVDVKIQGAQEEKPASGNFANDSSKVLEDGAADISMPSPTPVVSPKVSTGDEIPVIAPVE